MLTVISGGIILTPDQTLRDHHLVIEDQIIKSLVAGGVGARYKDERLIDAHGLWVIPGLIDIHVHGSYGHDTMDATPEALHEMARFFASHGVTSFLPTTVSTASEAITAAI
ncbi:MAG: amidohydrolase family protein, partial [Anaerolineales bacterium]|nr:amidohydrolase family protein [Anaerolineales bacterium]